MALQFTDSGLDSTSVWADRMCWCSEIWLTCSSSPQLINKTWITQLLRGVTAAGQQGAIEMF